MYMLLTFVANYESADLGDDERAINGLDARLNPQNERHGACKPRVSVGDVPPERAGAQSGDSR